MVPPPPALPPLGFPAGSAATLSPKDFLGPASGEKVEFNLYLPPGYAESDLKYPMVIDLHGIGGSRESTHGAAVEAFEAAMKASVVGPVIMVFPSGEPNAYWADSAGGQRGRTEVRVLKDLIEHIDANYKSAGVRSRRAVTGFSMGGFGAIAYGFKYPDLFVAAVGYDGALDTWQTLKGRRNEVAVQIFADTEAEWDKISPWKNAEVNRLKFGDVLLRGVPGMQYGEFHASFRDHVAALGIPYSHVDTDCDHKYPCLLAAEGENSWRMIYDAFKNAK
jgi:predicted peptidase